MSEPKNSSQKTFKFIIFGMLAFILSIAVLYVATIEKPIGEAYKPIDEYGGDFTLHTINGDVSLSDYRGKIVVIYFGFLNCTEACPVSMGTITKAISKLSKEERDKLQVFFLSVDPDRDTFESLNQFSEFYAKRYKDETNPEMILAISGNKDEIEKVKTQYGVFYELVDMEGSALGYTVDHSSRFYLIGTDGKLAKTMNHSTTPIELAARIKQLLGESTVKE